MQPSAGAIILLKAVLLSISWRETLRQSGKFSTETVSIQHSENVIYSKCDKFLAAGFQVTFKILQAILLLHVFRLTSLPGRCYSLLYS